MSGVVPTNTTLTVYEWYRDYTKTRSDRSSVVSTATSVSTSVLGHRCHSVHHPWSPRSSSFTTS